MYERFIARQPILDAKLNLCGYELLFRARDDNRAGAHPDATGQLIASSTMLFDWDGLLGGVNAHINFGAAELLSGVALLLPAAQTVVEIPATLEFTDDLVREVKNLRQAGYRVALDGYERQENLGAVLRHVDFVKVDFSKQDKRNAKVSDANWREKARSSSQRKLRRGRYSKLHGGWAMDSFKAIFS